MHLQNLVNILNKDTFLPPSIVHSYFGFTTWFSVGLILASLAQHYALTTFGTHGNLQTSTWSSSPRNFFLVEGGLPHGNNNAHQDLPSSLAQLQQFMNDVSWPLPFGNQISLLLTAPAPMEVDTNASPSKEAIWQSMTRMDKGADNKDQQSQILAIQHPSS
ncbi:hypothetical protein DSO57_1026550 [Entomophthora muscae]|uniref:Uncharacterized protein n=1 Tax=Entomophthora muscae TaxID=34485 RepID=A0ACC2SQW9_9FUNG|nr:hypothetical protein DSO57_1026550 [Entomophthora muscae]